MPISRKARESAQSCVVPLAGLRFWRYTVARNSRHRLGSPHTLTRMASPFRNALGAALTVALAGCAIPTQTTQVAAGPEPVTVHADPAVPSPGQSTMLTITSPGADSIAFESVNGLDRYWTTHDTLRLQLDPDFGDSVAVERYATRYQGTLLSRFMKPARITVCRKGSCETIYHDIPVALAEANHRTVALTAGYNTVFARRSLVGSHSTVLFREALSSGIWSTRAELSDWNWSGRLEGYAGQGERGMAFDLSRVVKHAGDLSYGVALHLDADRSAWLADAGNPVVTDRTGWRASVGPSMMLRGVTATSQIGIYNDGVKTLQIVSTRVSLSAEKTFAFGGGAIISRRRDALERLVASVQLVNDLAINVGLSSHQSAWPNHEPVDDLRASETLFTLGGQYTLTW